MAYIRELHDELGVNFTIQVVPEDDKMGYNAIVRSYSN